MEEWKSGRVEVSCSDTIAVSVVVLKYENAVVYTYRLTQLDLGIGKKVADG